MGLREASLPACLDKEGKETSQKDIPAEQTSLLTEIG